MKRFYLALYLSLFCVGAIFAQTAPAKYGPTPNERQMKYYNEPLAGFIHFGMNTFTNKEWGDGSETVANFNPTIAKANTDQWVRLFKEAGFERIIVTLKHHDGFCLWPTKLTDFNISKSVYQNGKGDLAQELSESCDKYGMDMGIYLSPWDIHEKSYGDASPGNYNDFYAGQMEELLSGKYGRMNPETGKREIIEIWLDGATGSGVEFQTYDFARYVELVRRLQPNCLTWMSTDATKNYNGPEAGFPLDAFWVGNEAGYVNDPVWAKLLVNGNSVSTYAPRGNYYSVPEADVSIRSGWFYHASSDNSVKSVDALNSIYFKSVGMGIPLLLNVPPTKMGVFHPSDSASLINFGKAIKTTFETNLIEPTMTVTASAERGAGFEASNVLDGNYDTYWTMADGVHTGSITVDLGKQQKLNIIKVQEYIPLGQRVSGFKIEVEVDGTWLVYGSGQTIGFQRMVKGEEMSVRKIRLTITSSLAVPLICNIAAYRYADANIVAGFETNSADQFQTIEPQKISKLKFEVIGFPAGHWPTLAEMRFFTRDKGKLVELDRSGITASATSYAKNSTNEPPSLPSNTLDNDNNTIWQPEWSPSKVTMPQSLTYNFGKQIECTNISYLPRQTSSQDLATSFKIYTAENSTDTETLSLAAGTFSATTNNAQMVAIKNNDWTVVQNYGIDGGTAIQAKKEKTQASYAFTGGWLKLIGGKGPNGGIMEVWVDNVKKATVDTYATIKLTDQVLCELNGLDTTAHVLKVVVTGTKNPLSTDALIVLQKATNLDPGVKAAFELQTSFAGISEDIGNYSFEIKRRGDLTTAADITFVTAPGSGVQGKNYLDVSKTLHFDVGDSIKIASVQILENEFKEGYKDFYIELKAPTNDHILGINKATRVLIQDNDTTLYCTDLGTSTARGDRAWTNTTIKSVSTTTVPVNVNSGLAAGVIYRGVKNIYPIDVQRGKNLVITSNGTFNALYKFVYADWNGDGDFDDEGEMLGQLPSTPTFGVGTGSHTTRVLNSSVPADAREGKTRIRVIFAWADEDHPISPNNVSALTSNAMACDFVVNVFEPANNSRTVTVIPASATDGSAYITGTTNSSVTVDASTSTVQVTATPNSGYVFMKWTNTDTNENVSENNPYTYVGNKDINLSAHFENIFKVSIPNEKEYYYSIYTPNRVNATLVDAGAGQIIKSQSGAVPNTITEKTAWMITKLSDGTLLISNPTSGNSLGSAGISLNSTPISSNGWTITSASVAPLQLIYNKTSKAQLNTTLTSGYQNLNNWGYGKGTTNSDGFIINDDGSSFQLLLVGEKLFSGVSSLDEDTNFQLFQNAHNQITVQYDFARVNNSKVSVFSSLGQKIISQKITSTSTVINADFARGVYLVALDNARKSNVKKIVIN